MLFKFCGIRKNCATYNDIGAEISDCTKINFIYGPNGSGKSTISNYLFNPIDLQYGECEIEWENDTAVDVVVYNREFREKNFKENSLIYIILLFFDLSRAII